jgi:hypothetical protein
MAARRNVILALLFMPCYRRYSYEIVIWRYYNYTYLQMLIFCSVHFSYDAKYLNYVQ